MHKQVVAVAVGIVVLGIGGVMVAVTVVSGSEERRAVLHAAAYLSSVTTAQQEDSACADFLEAVRRCESGLKPLNIAWEVPLRGSVGLCEPRTAGEEWSLYWLPRLDGKRVRTLVAPGKVYVISEWLVTEGRVRAHGRPEECVVLARVADRITFADLRTDRVFSVELSVASK